MKVKHGTIVNVIRDLCARPQGCSLPEAAQAIGRPMNCASSYLSKHLKAELTKAGCYGEYRYFTDSEKAAEFHAIAVAERAARLEASRVKKNAYRALKERERRAKMRADNPLPPKPPKPAKPPKRASTAMRQSGITLGGDPKEEKRLHKQATIIWPEHVQIQRAPTPKDDRFSFTPPDANWRGVISQDQQERWAA